MAGRERSSLTLLRPRGPAFTLPRVGSARLRKVSSVLEAPAALRMSNHRALQLLSTFFTSRRDWNTRRAAHSW